MASFPKVIREEVGAALNAARETGVIVCGLGLTGKAAVELFKRSGVKVNAVLDDDQRKSDFAASLGVRLLPLATEELRGSAFSLFSPGVNPAKELAQSVFNLGVPSISELDLLGHCVCEPLVGVTGTNGKSTTATLISQMLSAELVGNIGTPFIQLIEDLYSPQTMRKLVAEISSYQLEYASKVSPKVGVFLNLAENHLERHGTLECYFEEKLRLIEDASTTAVLCADDPMLRRIQRRAIWFGRTCSGEGSASYSKERIEVSLGNERFYFDLRESQLIGAHNRANLAAAAISALLCGATEREIQRVIEQFPGLEHRLELVPNAQGVIVINDSKATTPHATLSDLTAVRERYSDTPIHLMVGGQAKTGSWRELALALKPSVCEVVGFGADGSSVIEKIEQSEGRLDTSSFPNLADALSAVLSRIKPGEILLFAPGCASFDEFSGFEERGREFKRLVLR